MTIHIGDSKELDTYLPDLSYHSTWSSPEKFAAHIENIPKSDIWQPAGWEDNDDGFYGGKLSEALTLARTGWTEGTETVEKFRNFISSSHPLMPTPSKYGIVGATPDVPRAIAGNIFNMKAIDLRKSHRRPVLTIVSNMAAPWYINKNTITNRAAVVAAIIDQIEAKGFSCEVITTAISAHGKFTAGTSVILKQSSQPVDIGRLAFGLGHVGMFRRLMFCDRGGHKECRDIGSGLGSSYNKFPDNGYEKDIYYLPSVADAEHAFETEELSSTKGLDFLIKSLQDQKCPAFPRTRDEQDEQDE